MKWKIRLQKDFLILFLIAVVSVILYLQYLYNKKNLIDRFKSEEYAKTIQIRDKFKSVLNEAELIFKSKLDENLKVLNSLYLSYTGINNFNADKIAKIINKKYKDEGYYEVFVIDKNYKVIKASYKPDLGFNLGGFPKYRKVFEAVFSGKKKIDVSYLIFDYSSFTLKRYFLILSPDKKYLLQLAYVVNIYSKLRDIYYKLLNRYRDLNDIKLYFMDKYLIYPVNFKQRFQPKKPLEEAMDETAAILIGLLKDVGEYDKYAKMIENKRKCMIFEHLSTIVLQLFYSHNNILSKLNLNKHKYITYTLIEGFFKNFSNRLIIKNDFSTYILEKDIETIRNRFLIVLFSLGILALFMKFLVYYMSSKIKELVIHMKENRPVEKTNSYIKEFDDLAEAYNEYRKRLNEEIEKNKNLLMENRRFIVDTVHQLKTPLSIITLNSDFLKMQIKDKNIEETLNEIEAAIAMLTNSYEDLSYLAAEKTVEYKPVELNLSDIVKQRVEFFTPLAKARNKNIVTDIDEGIIYKINKVEFERLVDNNISNAIDYSKGKEIKVSLKKSDNGFVLRVESFGEKIKEPQKLFEKNYREHTHKRGLGIGLNIVKKICDKYGIEYKVISKEGKNIFEYVFKS